MNVYSKPEHLQSTSDIKNSSLIFFGFGETCKRLVEFANNHKFIIHEIWDNYAPDTQYGSINVCKPNLNSDKSVFIIITVATHTTYETIRSQLVSLGFKNIFHYSELLLGESFTWNEHRQLIHEITRSETIFKKRTNSYQYVLDSIDVILTEKCSLKCKECSNLMQYFADPKDQKVDDVLQDMDQLLNTVDYIEDVRLLGGEPFVCADLYRYVNYLKKQSNIGLITIFTNGTIVPKKENLECLMHEKVLVRISDYGPPSKHLKELEQICLQNHIMYEIIPYSTWIKCAGFEKNNRSIDENKQILEECCANNLITLRNHQLFRCPFLASAWALHAIPTHVVESISLNDKSPLELKKDIFSYINQPYLKACDYCLGRPKKGGPEIPAAEQCQHPLSYTKYD